MTLEIGVSFARDSRPEARRSAVGILAGAEEPEALRVLARLVAEQDQRTWSSALDAIYHRLPWLGLEPFMRMDPSAESIASPEGRQWESLVSGIDLFVREWIKEKNDEMLKRWLRLPGAIHDVASALERIGEVEKANTLRGALALHGGTQQERRQALIAPTYGCNISCSYCYSKEWDKKSFPGSMSARDLDHALAWMRENDINLVQLSGGEPTIYPRFRRLLEGMRNNGIAVWLTSNCLYPQKIRPLVTAEYIQELIAHYDQESLSDDEARRRMFMDNVSAAVAAGVTLVFRYTLTRESGPMEWSKVIKAAKEAGARQLNYGFAFRNAYGDNSHFDFSTADRASFDPLFTGFMEDVDRAGLALHQSKPFPLCLVSRETLQVAIRSGAIYSCCTVANSGNTQNLTINPDLSVYPCNGVAKTTGEIINSTSRDTLGKKADALVRSLQSTHSLPECGACIMFYTGVCHGVCLAERLVAESLASGRLEGDGG